MTPRIPIDAAAVRQPQPVAPSRFDFPDPRGATEGGLVGWGGDFEPGTILAAYAKGIFPWPHEGIDHLWFSPDPRAIIPIGGLHVSRRLARRLRQGCFRVTIDRAFRDVLEACADRGDEGTWITPGYQRAYVRLHELGHAHSFEVWTAGDELAGGLDGIAVGGLFGAESMFHRVTDASKVAMAAMMQHLEERRFALVDVQLMTPHLESMGAVEVPREEYLRRVEAAVSLQRSFVDVPG